jgi:hypothetical protein
MRAASRSSGSKKRVRKETRPFSALFYVAASRPAQITTLLGKFADRACAVNIAPKKLFG